MSLLFDYMFFIKNIRRYNFVKNIIFKIIKMNVKIVNCWYLVFLVTPRKDLDMFQSCYMNENKMSNLIKHLSNIPNRKYFVAHNDGVFYTSCMSI